MSLNDVRLQNNCARLLCAALILSIGQMSQLAAADINFQQRQEQVKEKFEKRRNQPLNRLVHDPPMGQAKTSKLGDDEAVIGVHIAGEARAYPLVMLFGGGGVFELLNDKCGDVPIAVSW